MYAKLQHVRTTALVGQWWAKLISVVLVFEVKDILRENMYFEYT